MMTKLILVTLTFLFSITLNAQLSLRKASPMDHDSLYTAVQIEDLSKLYYMSDDTAIKIKFDAYQGYRIFLDGDSTGMVSQSPLILTDLKRGDHTITLSKQQEDCAVPDEYNKSFKLKKRPPFVSNDAAVLGLLTMVLFLVFKSAASQRPFLRKFYNIVPALLLCYFIPAALNSFGIVSSEESQLYFIASRYLLPASLVLLCLSIDIPSIRKLGSKAIIMFFAATVGIVLGGPIALYLVSLIAPEVLNDTIWRGLSTVAGSWIGGGANQTAMKEIYEAPDQLFSAMIVVDVFIANIFMSILLYGTGLNKKINKFFKADDSAIEALKTKMENFQASIAKIPTFNDLVKMIGITFFAVGLAHFLADIIGPLISDGLDTMRTPFDPCLGIPFADVQQGGDIAADLMVSFGSRFFWLVVLSTLFGVLLSFTKFRNLEGVGASKMGSLFLYVLVATIGMKMDIFELIANWGIFKFLVSIGLIWIMVHAIFLFVVAKIIKAPFFYVAVGSQANVGGAASAPIVASAFSPSLAPVGVLLAVLGYAVGTFGAILCTILMQYLSVV
jgi:uncharacterized membrane protein